MLTNENRFPSFVFLWQKNVFFFLLLLFVRNDFKVEILSSFSICLLPRCLSLCSAFWIDKGNINESNYFTCRFFRLIAIKLLLSIQFCEFSFDRHTNMAKTIHDWLDIGLIENRKTGAFVSNDLDRADHVMVSRSKWLAIGYHFIFTFEPIETRPSLELIDVFHFSECFKLQ